MHQARETSQTPGMAIVVDDGPPLTGTIVFEELIAPRVGRSGRQRLAAVLLAGAAMVTLGIQGRWFGPESARNDDGISRPPATSSTAAPLAGTSLPDAEPELAPPGPESRATVRLPIGFAVLAVPLEAQAIGHLAVVGYVPAGQLVAARLLDQEGKVTALATTSVGALQADTGLAAFRVMLPRPGARRDAGPGGWFVELAWTSGDGARWSCLVPIGLGQATAGGPSVGVDVADLAVCTPAG